MDISATISENLAEWMAKTPALDTLKKLSAKSGVGFGTVQRAKNGDGNITVENLALIAAAFGRSPVELLTLKGAEADLPDASPAPRAEAALEQMSIDAAAKILVEQAGEVSALWVALPPERRTTVLRQLRDEAGHPPGEARILAPLKPKPAGATRPDTKARREAG